jgi:rSAM/selenodomain-associated transferase 1
MSTALVIFAKAPVAGVAKTRLIPALGAQGAARLAEKLLNHAVGHALAADFDEVQLCVTPDATHAAFRRLAAQENGRLSFSSQGEGDLGERMDGALTKTLQRHDKVLVIGTDAPGLVPVILRSAASALDSHDVVIVPALDGGYALVGLRQPAPALFSDMAWSTSQVLAETRTRALALGLRYAELTPVPDVDEPGDLIHLPAGWLP